VFAQLSLYTTMGPTTFSRLLGVSRWPIFLDAHFTVPAPLYRLAYITPAGERPIPSFDVDGRPTTRDRYWKCVGFELRWSPQVGPLYRYLVGWQEKEGLHGGRARVYCKDVSLRTLDLDFRMPDEIRARPWRVCGEIQLVDSIAEKAGP